MGEARHIVRTGTASDLDVRLVAFERHFGMSTQAFAAAYEEDEAVEGVHPHIVALWYGAYLQRCRIPGIDVGELEALLA